jgi:hypothetical protein
MPNHAYLTYSTIFRIWMNLATLAVMQEAKRLVSGPLLKVGTGTLLNSFYREVKNEGHLGIVGNNAPHAQLWEFQGLGGPKTAPKGHAFKIVKRGVFSPRGQKGVIYRRTIRPSGKYARPVAFLWTATKNEFSGTKGEEKLTRLGTDVAYALASRYARMLELKGANVTIRMI